MAHRPTVPPGQLDIMPTRSPVSHHVLSTHHEQAFSSHSDALTPGLVIVDILLTVLRATQSKDIFSSLYGYMAFVNRKWLPLNI